MKQNPERKFRNKIRPLLDILPNSWWESIQQKSIKGTPDLLGCINGIFVGMELKASTGKVSALQQYKIDKIKAAGGVGIVVSPENFKEIYMGLEKLAYGN